MREDEIRTTVHDYLRHDFIYDESQKLDDDQSLLGSGVLDSTGILELITYLEEIFKIEFQDDELVADNFDSVNKIAEFLSQRTQRPELTSDVITRIHEAFGRGVS